MTEDYAAITHGIRVSVRAFYLEDQSQPEDSNFAWAYRVKIENHSDSQVQLLSRTWKITDGRGTMRHVHGDGVVGEQPVLNPGTAFEYTSGNSLPTPSGVMMGEYHMIEAGTGVRFDVKIPAFSLDSPHEHSSIH